VVVSKPCQATGFAHVNDEAATFELPGVIGSVFDCVFRFRGCWSVRGARGTGSDRTIGRYDC